MAANEMITVKKKRSHRVIFGTVCFLSFSVITFFALYAIEAMLLYIPLALFLLPATLYYFTWRLDFERDGIVRRLFFRQVKRYSYTQLCRVEKQFYLSENSVCILLCFEDGKKILFRLDDDGAMQALRRVQRHCSIIS